MEADLLPALLGHRQVAAIGHHEGGGLDRVPRNAGRVGLDELLQLVRVLGRDPAGHLVAGRQEARLHAIFGLQPVGHHLELQLADGAQQQRSAQMRPEDLNGTFLAQLGEAGTQLLALHRVSQLDDLEELGRKEGQPGELQLLAFGQRVAQLQHAMVGQTDDVARPGVFHQLAAL